MKLWFLVFMFLHHEPFSLQPMVSGPHELEVCLSMAQTNTIKYGFRAHCYKPYTREYPDMKKEYL